jgi:hypothetical protein
MLTKFIGVEVLKCKEGMNNKAFLLKMDNGSVVFAKLPNACAGPPFTRPPQKLPHVLS